LICFIDESLGIFFPEATLMGTRMTRMKRIYADFLLPAAKVFLATNFHK
jgi:hypothetical protein